MKSSISKAFNLAQKGSKRKGIIDSSIRGKKKKNAIIERVNREIEKKKKEEELNGSAH